MSNCYQIHKHFHGGKMKQEKLLMHLGKQMSKSYNEKIIENNARRRIQEQSYFLSIHSQNEIETNHEK